MYFHQRITVIRVEKPSKKSDINEKLQWLCTSLGLFSERDKDSSCFRIFIELLKSGRTKVPLTSDEIAFRLHLSRGTVIHHINKLLRAGIVVHTKNIYYLRVSSLSSLIDEIEGDIERVCEDMKEIAENIDAELG